MFQLRWLWRQIEKTRHFFIIGLILSAITSGMLIINPFLSQQLIDKVVIPKNTALLLPILGAMLVAQLLRLTLRYIMVMCLEENSQTMLDDVRRHLYSVIQNQDYHFFGRMRTGDLMTRLTSDLEMLRHSMAWISYNIVDSVVIFTAALVYLFTVNWVLTLSLSAITPLILILTRVFSKKLRPLYVQLRMKLSGLNTVAQENIAGNRVVKAFAREEYEMDKFNTRNDEFKDASLEPAVLGAKFQPVIDLLSQSLTVTTLLLGGLFMIQGKLTAGEMLAFTSLTWALSNPLRSLGVLLNDLQRFFASCSVIIEIFYSQADIVDKYGAKEIQKRPSGDLEFQNVSLVLNKTSILHDISFHLPAGKTLGIIGNTGSGKTSLVNLIMRFYEPAEGEILLDGENIQQYTLGSLRSSFGLAMQDVFLFSDTVAGNIGYGRKEMPLEEAERYAHYADADKFIEKMPEGYDTLIGERGLGLSGGQRQRVSLARALAMRPSILILDDTTSAVDMETERYIQKQLKELDFECSKVIVAQRISSIQNADLILVLEDGRIVEQGSHQQLISQEGYYKNIWRLQNGFGLEVEL